MILYSEDRVKNFVSQSTTSNIESGTNIVVYTINHICIFYLCVCHIYIYSILYVYEISNCTTEINMYSDIYKWQMSYIHQTLHAYTYIFKCVYI